MKKVQGKDIRVYLTDEPGFLSCGPAYLTDANNGIILFEGADDNDFSIRSSSDVPYTLAPFPIPRSHIWSIPLQVGTKVYPSCDVDQPSMGHGDEKEFHPMITDIGSLSRGELDGFLQIYREQLSAYNAKTSKELEKLNAEMLEKLEQWARSREAILKEKYHAPNLVKLIKGKIR